MQDSHQTPKPSSNRKHKDSLFVDYFSKDRDWKKHFLSLYNALHGTNLQVETTKLERMNIKQVLYKTYYNDISVLVNGQLLVLIKHQSTINPNMPLRLLEYVTRVYSKLIDSDKKFSEKQQLLPLPEFYVFYTGKDSFPAESVLKLSDSFIKPKDKKISDYPLELVVKVCKINGKKPSSVVAYRSDLNNYKENSTSGVLRGRIGFAGAQPRLAKIAQYIAIFQPLAVAPYQHGAGVLATSTKVRSFQRGWGLRGRKPALPSRGVSFP